MTVLHSSPLIFSSFTISCPHFCSPPLSSYSNFILQLDFELFFRSFIPPFCLSASNSSFYFKLLCGTPVSSPIDTFDSTCLFYSPLLCFALPSFSSALFLAFFSFALSSSRFPLIFRFSGVLSSLPLSSLQCCSNRQGEGYWWCSADCRSSGVVHVT